MQKMIRKLLFVAVILALVSSSFSCVSDSGQEVSMSIYGKYDHVDHPGEYLELKKDGTFYMWTGTGYSGGWEQDGNEIILSGFSFGMAAKFKIEGSTLYDEYGGAWAKQQSSTTTSEASTQEEKPIYNQAFITDQNFEDYSCMPLDEIRIFLAEWNSSLQGQIEDVDSQVFEPAQEIYNAAMTYQISPRVLLATMEKEQRAITSTQLPTNRLTLLMGAGSPSTARRQILYAAQLFRSYLNDLSSKGATVSGWKVSVPKLTEDGVEVTPVNKAVTALFTYTPYAGVQWGGNQPQWGGNYLFYDAWCNKFRFDEEDFKDDKLSTPEPIPEVASISPTRIPSTEREYIDLLPTQVYDRLLSYKLTTVQRQQNWSELDGKWVRWSGYVVNVLPENIVSVRHYKTGLATAVVNFGPEPSERIAGLSKGEEIYFSARLTDYGVITYGDVNRLQGVSLDQGELISRNEIPYLAPIKGIYIETAEARGVVEITNYQFEMGDYGAEVRIQIENLTDKMISPSSRDPRYGVNLALVVTFKDASGNEVDLFGEETRYSGFLEGTGKGRYRIALWIYPADGDEVIINFWFDTYSIEDIRKIASYEIMVEQLWSI